MIMGASTVNLAGSDFGTANTNYGPLGFRRSYQGAADFSGTYGIPTSFTASNAHIDWNTGTLKSNYVSIFSMKPNIDLMGNCSLDVPMMTFLQSIPTDHRIILCMWHEADGKVRQGTFTKDQWQKANERFMKLIRSFGGLNIYSGICLEAYQPHTGTDFADMIPDTWYAQELVDCFLVDGYSDLGTKGAVWDYSINYAQLKNVPWGVAEAGVKSGTVTGTWMSDQVSYCCNADAEMFCWFDNTVGTVLATPGATAEGKASAQMASKLLYQDSSTWMLG